MTNWIVEFQHSLNTTFAKKVRHIAGRLETSRIQKYRNEAVKELLKVPLIPLRLDSGLKQLARSQAVLISDFHTAAFTLDFTAWLYDRLKALETKVLPARAERFIGLEVFSTRYQRELNEFSVNKLSAESLLSLAFHHALQWGVPLSDLKRFLRSTRASGAKLIALNQPSEFPRSKRFQRDQDLWERDQWAAGVITDLFIKSKKSRCLAIFGEWHLGATHLPGHLKQVSRHAFKRPLLVSTLFLNSDYLFWRVLKENAGKGKTGPLPSFFSCEKDRLATFTCSPWEKSVALLSHLELDLEDDAWELSSMDSKFELYREACQTALGLESRLMPEPPYGTELGQIADPIAQASTSVIRSLEYAPGRSQIRLENFFYGLMRTLLRPLDSRWSQIQSKETEHGRQLALAIISGTVTIQEVRRAIFFSTDTKRVHAKLVGLLRL